MNKNLVCFGEWFCVSFERMYIRLFFEYLYKYQLEQGDW